MRIQTAAVPAYISGAIPLAARQAEIRLISLAKVVRYMASTEPIHGS